MRHAGFSAGVALLALATPDARAMAQSAPADSTLAAACAAGGGIADGLLVVVFRSDVPGARRAALVREAGGRLGGEAPDGGADARYVMLPPEGRAVLDAVADRLIRRDGVESVGGTVCPPPQPPSDTARRDSAAAIPQLSPAPADSLREGSPGAPLPTPGQ
jgi:hypothetical protein